MTKPPCFHDISHQTIEAIAAAMVPIVADAAAIVADARATYPTLPGDSATEMMMSFVGRVLEHCVARVDGSPLYPSRTPAIDAALAAATLRAIARWPDDHARELDAWRTALALFLDIEQGHLA